MVRKVQEPRRGEAARETAMAGGSAAALVRVLLGPFRRIGLGRWMSVAVLLLFVALRSWDPTPIETLRLKTFDLY